MSRSQTKKSTNKGSTPSAADDVYFITKVRPAPGTAEAHGLKEWLFGTKRPLDEVKSDVGAVFNQAAQLAETATDKTPAGFDLDSISFSLGFDAGGKLGFIAEASVSASVEITFQRAKPAGFGQPVESSA
ncbi:MAG: hypothetical protein AB7V46_05380 [Thermomicrobiales bacterium]